MPLATITSKGQVTIPKEIRESLKLNAGDKIEIISTNDKQAIIRPISKKVDDIFCKLHDPDRKAITLIEMRAAIKKRMSNANI